MADEANKVSLNEQHSDQSALTAVMGDLWSLAPRAQGKAGTRSSGDMEAGPG